jgi:hypothetical protein
MIPVVYYLYANAPYMLNQQKKGHREQGVKKRGLNA